MPLSDYLRVKHRVHSRWWKLTSLSRFSVWRHKHTTGWQVSLRMFAVLSCVVLLINIAIAASLPAIFGLHVGLSMLMDGSCDETKRASLLAHVVINICSTLLLAGSHFTMQILSAPSRAEVDRAHSRKVWLDIGVLSIRNLWSIDRRRALLWSIFGLSSLPLHLFFNSVIYQSPSTNWYQVYVTTDDFFQQPLHYSGSSDYISNSSLIKWHSNPSLLQHLTPLECIRSYDTSILSDRKNLVLVTEEHSSGNGSTVLGALRSGDEDFFSWMCEELSYAVSDYCDTTTLLSGVANGGDWVLRGHTVKYCMSQQVEQQCRLYFSLPIMLAVISCNVGKVVAMFFSLRIQHEQPLLTIGDAIASFMRNPDPTTKNMCLYSWHDFSHGPQAWSRSRDLWQGGFRRLLKSSRNHTGSHFSWKSFRRNWNELRRVWNSPNYFGSHSGERMWHLSPRRWWTAASATRWIVTLSLSLLTLTMTSVLLARGVQNLDNKNQSTTLAALWDIGLGTADARSLVWLSGDHGYWGYGFITAFTQTVLAVNSPQLVLSFLYMMINGLLTCMLLAREWGSYAAFPASTSVASSPKGLRVSSKPLGEQRTNYYLQVPFRYGIPVMAVSTLLHWLVSQSLFLYQATVVDWDGTVLDVAIGDRDTRPHAAYSCIAIVFVLMLGILLLMALLALGWSRKLEAGMVMVGSCSAAISAACHPPLTDECDATDSGQRAVWWGVTLESHDECDDEGLRATLTIHPNESGGEGHDLEMSSIGNSSSEGIHKSTHDAELLDGDAAPTQRAGHCSFSAGPVTRPIVGQYYKGY